MRREKGWTLLEVCLVALLVGLLSTILLPLLGHAIRRCSPTTCGSNLRQAYCAMRALSVDRTRQPGEWPVPGDSLKDGTPVPAGSGWWRLLTTTGEVSDLQLVCCAARYGNPPGPAYWGPLTDPNRFADQSPVGMDAEGAHGECAINVVTKAGDVQQLMVADVDELHSDWRRHVGP